MGDYEIIIHVEADTEFEGDGAEDVLKLVLQALQRSRLDEKGIKLIDWTIEEA